MLDGVSLEADRGELVAIMGQSGSGKTTLLRAIAGLEPFRSGQIAVDDVTLESGSPSAQTRRALCRKVGMVFQFHCLFEHMSALDNVCLAPVHAYGVARARRRTARARTAAGVWRGAPPARVAEKPVRGRGTARRDRAGPCRRPAGAAHGRADGVARSRAPRGARRADAQPHRRRAHAGRRHPRRRVRARVGHAAAAVWRMARCGGPKPDLSSTASRRSPAPPRGRSHRSPTASVCQASPCM